MIPQLSQLQQSLHRACCCGGCDTVPAIDGCLTCSCARSDTYKICIQGEIDDAAVLNSSGHTLTRVSDWLFRFTSAASFKVELEFDPDEADAGDFEIRSYLWDGAAFVLERTLTGSVVSMATCTQTLTSGGVTYTMAPLEETVPSTVTVTTDYDNAAQITCTDNRAYGHATKTWIIDAFTGLDGTFTLDRVPTGGDRCTYTTTQGTVSMYRAEVDPTERMDDVPVVWTFNLISKTLTVNVDFSGTANPLMTCHIWEVTFTDGPYCVPAGGTYGPKSNEIGCGQTTFDPIVGGTVNGGEVFGTPLDLDFVEVDVTPV